MPKELRVRGRADEQRGLQPTDPAKLAGAIAAEVRAGDPPVVTAVGRYAEAIARQGLELAQSYLAVDGRQMEWSEESAVIDFGDGSEKRKQVRFPVSVAEGTNESTEVAVHGSRAD